MFAFPYVKATSKEICEGISLHPTCMFRKLLSDSRLIISKNAWLNQFSFVDSNSPCKDQPLIPRGLDLAQKPLHSVGTVLERTADSSITFSVTSANVSRNKQ